MPEKSLQIVKKNLSEFFFFINFLEKTFRKKLFGQNFPEKFYQKKTFQKNFFQKKLLGNYFRLTFPIFISKKKNKKNFKLFSKIAPQKNFPENSPKKLIKKNFPT